MKPYKMKVLKCSFNPISVATTSGLTTLCTTAYTLCHSTGQRPVALTHTCQEDVHNDFISLSSSHHQSCLTEAVLPVLKVHRRGSGGGWNGGVGEGRVGEGGVGEGEGEGGVGESGVGEGGLGEGGVGKWGRGGAQFCSESGTVSYGSN